MAVYELRGETSLACLAVYNGRSIDREYIAIQPVRLAVVFPRMPVPARLIISRQTEIYPAYSHLIPRQVKYFG